MYGGTGGPWLSSDEFVRVEKETKGGFLPVPLYITHDVLYLPSYRNR